MRPPELSQLGLSLTNVILTTWEYAPRVIDYAPKIIYSTGVTHDDRHLQSSHFYNTGHRIFFKRRVLSTFVR